MKNPKDSVVHCYETYKSWSGFRALLRFDDFFERCTAGEFEASPWFEHVKSWYQCRHQFDILFITYEEMLMDLRASVNKICTFLGKELSDQAVSEVMRSSSFSVLNIDPLINWKCYFSPEQSQKMDQLIKEKLMDLPVNFKVWE
ncbi:amine sulfotransferase-like [Pholidichthys leucotaenia]